jgi:hypothetical protein
VHTVDEVVNVNSDLHIGWYVVGLPTYKHKIEASGEIGDGRETGGGVLQTEARQFQDRSRTSVAFNTRAIPSYAHTSADSRQPAALAHCGDASFQTPDSVTVGNTHKTTSTVGCTAACETQGEFVVDHST